MYKLFIELMALKSPIIASLNLASHDILALI